MRLNKYALKAQVLFRNNLGEPFKLTKGQQEIYELIANPNIKRGVCKAITQYGKSEIAAMALIDVAASRKEKILIVAPSEKQAGIIMNKIIDHLFDHPVLTGMISVEGKVERLRHERSKKRVTFKNGSDIMLLTAEAGTLSKEAKGLMGFGATIVLVDESALIPRSMFSKILRMVGGTEGKIIQLSNPFTDDNQFKRAFDSPRYKKISINWKQALEEKRVSKKFLDEAKEEISDLDWKVFYDCEFPESGNEDVVIPLSWIKNAVNQKLPDGEDNASGLDVARFGKDSTVYLNRCGPNVKRIEVIGQIDTMEVIGWVRGFMNEDKPEWINIDEIGVGAGVVDRMIELDDVDCEINGINVGASPSDEEAKNQYFNLRAEIWFYVRELFKPNKEGISNISIPDDKELIRELNEIRFKYSSERKRKIESKDDMKKRLGKSPDKADALALAFYPLTAHAPELIMM